jgi:hypothetical protein
MMNKVMRLEHHFNDSQQRVNEQFANYQEPGTHGYTHGYINLPVLSALD